MTLDNARSRMIRTAADLFHKQGIHLTSPDEILQASGTGKGQFYHYFRNKEDLIHAVMRLHLDSIESGTFGINFDIDTWQALETWFNDHIEMQKQFDMMRGCPVGTIGHDLTERHELIRQDVSLIFEVMKRKLSTFFVREKGRGFLAETADEEALSTFCIAVIQGGMLLGKVARSSMPVEWTAAEARRHLARYRVVAAVAAKRGKARSPAPPSEPPHRYRFTRGAGQLVNDGRNHPPAIALPVASTGKGAVASPHNGDNAKLRIIQAADNLFHQQGIHRTTPNDIMDAAGISRGQFYHYFKNKDAMIHEVLQTKLQGLKDNTRPVNFEIDSWDELAGWFCRNIEVQKMFHMARECPLATIGNDITEGDEQMRADVQELLELATEKLQNFFVKEKARGGLANDANEKILATFCMASIQGALLLGKVARNCRPAELAVSEAIANLRHYALPRGPLQSPQRA